MSAFAEKEIITIVAVGSSATLLLSAFLVSFVYAHQRRHFAFLQEKQAIRSQFQEELLKTRLEIQEDTFRTISEEIHDNIGQTLSFIKLNLNTMQSAMSERDFAKWVESKELLTKVIQDLRNLSRTLNTDFIQEIGLESAVKQQLDLLEKTGLYSISLDIQGERWSCTAAVELVLYRVIQELINNIVKHADASAIRIKLDYRADALVVVVADNGKGFDPRQLADTEPKGIGLRNIKSRISLIGGSIDIGSNPGEGSVIEIHLSPFNQNIT